MLWMMTLCRRHEGLSLHSFIASGCVDIKGFLREPPHDRILDAPDIALVAKRFAIACLHGCIQSQSAQEPSHLL